MHRITRAFLTGLLILSAVLAYSALLPVQASAQYTQLQVLLPGETEAPGTMTGKLGSPRAQTVGIPFQIRIRACDADWYAVPSNTNNVSVTSSDESATLPGTAALVAGEIYLAVTLNAAGSFTISAIDRTDLTIPEATSSVVTLQALQGFLFNTISQKHRYAGVPDSYTLTAVDPNGITVTGYDGPIGLKQMTSYGEGRISPDEVTLVNGTWAGSLTMYRADETSINRGNVNIQACLPSDPSINGISDPFIVHPGQFARVQIIVPGQSPAPGSVSGFTGSPASQGAGQTFNVDIYATDEYWNPVPGIDMVSITSDDPNASTPVSGALTDGLRSFIVSLGTVGVQTLTVTDQTNGSIEGMTSMGIQVIPSAPDHFEIGTIISSVTAGEAITVTIRAADVSGNTIPDYNGDAMLSANTGPGSISPEAIKFANGVWTGDMVFRGAGGAVSFTCSDFSSPPHTGTSNSMQVLPGQFSGLQVLLPGQVPQGGTVPGYSGTPTAQNAGSSFHITVRAVDGFWNRVPGIDDRFSLTSSDPFAGVPAETSLVNGELTLPVTLYKAGTQTITVADLDSAVIDQHTSSPVEVLAGSYSRILILAPGEELAPGTAEGRTGTATDQSINFAFTVTVHATDAWWNTVTGISDVIRVTSTDPMAELPPDTELSSGKVALDVRLSTGGYQQITASNVTQPGMPWSTTQVRVISSGFHLEAEASPSRVQAGEPFTLTVKVTNDAGSVIQEINSMVNIEVRNASTQDPGRGILLITQFQLLQGQRSLTETYTFAEPIVLVASDDAGNEPAVSNMITIDPGPPERLGLSSDPPWVRGNRHATVSAHVLDAYDNGVPGQPVEFELVGGTGTLTPIDSLTGAGGAARADFLSPRVPEVALVRAYSNSLAGEIEIETSLVDPNQPGGTVTNYPNPFHPEETPTTIVYKLSDNAAVNLKIFTLSGGLVLIEDFAPGMPGGAAGFNEFQWDGRNGKGDYVSSGGYICLIRAEGAGETLHVMRRRIAVVR